MEEQLRGTREGIPPSPRTRALDHCPNQGPGLGEVWTVIPTGIANKNSTIFPCLGPCWMQVYHLCYNKALRRL